MSTIFTKTALIRAQMSDVLSAVWSSTERKTTHGTSRRDWSLVTGRGGGGLQHERGGGVANGVSPLQKGGRKRF